MVCPRHPPRSWQLAAFTVLADCRVEVLAGMTTLNLWDTNLRQLDIVSNIDKAALDLQLEVQRDPSVGSAPRLIIDGPSELILPTGLSADPSIPRGALVNLTYTCAAPWSSSSGASEPRGNAALTILACSTAMSLLTPLPRHQALPALALGILLGTVVPRSAWACGGRTRLTLVVSPEQFASVHSCGLCPPEAQGRSMKFMLRPKCDLAAAAAAFDAAASACSLPDPCPMHSCDVDGWCEDFHGPASASNCSKANASARWCSHFSFKGRLLERTTAAGGALVNQTFDCLERATPVEGRPYTTRRGALVAPASCEPDGGWALRLASKHTVDPDAWSSEIGQVVAESWLRHGQEEHASIASFARFSLELLRFGAPPHLLLSTQAAAAEEVRHAQRSFGLAVQFGAGLDVQSAQQVSVGEFPLDTANIEISESLEALVKRSLQEGCFGESAAVTRLALARRIVNEDSPAKAVIEELLADEARHAALAWATVRWAVRKGTQLPRVDTDAPTRTTALSPPWPVSFVWGGRIPQGTATEIGRMVQRQWVGPWAASLAQGQMLPEVSGASGYLDRAMAEAMHLVRAQLERDEVQV